MFTKIFKCLKMLVSTRMAIDQEIGSRRKPKKLLIIPNKYRLLVSHSI